MTTSWQYQFEYWIKETEEKIELWQSSNPIIVSAKIHLHKEGINFEKLILDKWHAQIRAWKSDLIATGYLSEEHASRGIPFMTEPR